MKHRIRWFVYANDHQGHRERLPREASMRGHWDGYDVECSCGWKSATGGAIKARITEAVEDHKSDAAWRAENGIETDEDLARWAKDYLRKAQ